MSGRQEKLQGRDTNERGKAHLMEAERQETAEEMKEEKDRGQRDTD